MSVYRTKDGDKVFIECNCGCGDSLKVQIYDWSDVEVAGFQVFNPYAKGFGERLARAGHALFKKDHPVVDVLMAYDEWKEFVAYINEMDKLVNKE